ncbi:MAG: hypothetical protein N2Z76_09360 [Treponemataceae bacterium]|nr:hypothetical protein [Treponemataceae bacterium]
MKKQWVMIAVVALLMVSPCALFAAGPGGMTGLGVYGSFGSTGGISSGGVGLSLKFSSFPVIGLKYDFTASRFNTSVDYYVIDAESLGSNFSYFLGIGGYFGIAGGSQAQFDFGLRMPLGLQFWPIKKFEIFLSPLLAIPLYPTPNVGFGVELGARIRF